MCVREGNGSELQAPKSISCFCFLHPRALVTRQQLHPAHRTGHSSPCAASPTFSPLLALFNDSLFSHCHSLLLSGIFFFFFFTTRQFFSPCRILSILVTVCWLCSGSLPLRLPEYYHLPKDTPAFTLAGRPSFFLFWDKMLLSVYVDCPFLSFVHLALTDNDVQPIFNLTAYISSNCYFCL